MCPILLPQADSGSLHVQASDLPLRYGYVLSPAAVQCEIGKVFVQKQLHKALSHL